MEEEEFQFSPLKPILLVVAAPLIYVYILRGLNLFVRNFSLYGLIVTVGLVSYTWKYLRITFLMLTLRPAVILTDESITITSANYIISWKDVQDVYLASSGGDSARSIKSYYIVVSVREPEKYFKQIKNPFTRYYRRWTRNWRPSPFEVDLSLIRGNEDEIYHPILRYYQNNRGF
jgi:hypothetical protein